MTNTQNPAPTATNPSGVRRVQPAGPAAGAVEERGIRTKFIDYNARREPKTEHWCFMCQRDLKPGQPYRAVHVVDGALAVHPDGPQPADHDLHGIFAMGMDCAKKLGMEWTRDPSSPKPAFDRVAMQCAVEAFADALDDLNLTARQAELGKAIIRAGIRRLNRAAP